MDSNPLKSSRPVACWKNQFANWFSPYCFALQSKPSNPPSPRPGYRQPTSKAATLGRHRLWRCLFCCRKADSELSPQRTRAHRAHQKEKPVPPKLAIHRLLQYYKVPNNSSAISRLSRRMMLSSTSSRDRRFILPYQTTVSSITAKCRQLSWAKRTSQPPMRRDSSRARRCSSFP